MTGPATDPALADRLRWASEGGDLFLRELDALDDAVFAGPCLLPGWTVAHLVAHLGYNAEALRRLARWARTGEETPMYASREARNAEIEEGAALPPAELRKLAHDAETALRADLAELPEAAWAASVRTAQGRTVPAAEVPWMRAREVWIHAADLGTGAGFADFPAPLVDTLLTEIAGQRTAAGRGPALVLTAADRDRTWTVDADGAPPARLRGRAADLARWLTGRGASGVTADGGDVPDPGRWL